MSSASPHDTVIRSAASMKSDETLGDVAHTGAAPSHHDEAEKSLLGGIAGRFPTDTFLWLTLGSIALSASMKISGRSKDANFVGEWAPTFVGLGVLSKLIKVEKALRDLR